MAYNACSKMKSRVYVETSVVSYLTARPSRDIVQAGHQEVTRNWWARRDRFDLFVSRTVIREAARGDTEAASRRSAALQGIPILAVTTDASDLAERLLRENAMPAKAAIDALHVAIAVINGIDYLLTWNCAHIANVAIRRKIEKTCRDAGLQPTAICTPEELMEE